MNSEEIIKELPPIVSDEFEIASLEWINQKPHPYCITPLHVAYASDHHFGMLGEEAILGAEKRGARCGMYSDGAGRWANGRTGRCVHPCMTPYKEHTKGEHVLFVRALVDRKSPADLFGLRPWLVACKSVMEKHGIAGVAFVEASHAD